MGGRTTGNQEFCFEHATMRHLLAKWRLSSRLLDKYTGSSDERVNLRATGIEMVCEGTE